ncbi:hypothetical protein CR205_17950 [Alteribacter lacisalsi]|uniref:DUF2232 domain-containing protein n=1 Tax=Alteribacter lacisalsi TaxID=2045244 RepID=A0A2W0H505_9BACI|nr:YybS family protein [Alteribacter lacisalsi]PYZ96237.1 hypothetical protein CR205_17950 [Alteribacter lacisalsi]
MKEPNPLRDGSIYLGIYVALIIITLFVPVIGLLSMLLLPVPFVIFTKRYGLGAGSFLLTLSFVILLLLALPLAVVTTLTFAATGVVIGELYRRNKEAFAVLLGGSLTFVSALLINFVGSIVLLDVHPVYALQNVLRESIETTGDMIGILGDQGDAVGQAMDIIDQLPLLTPALLILIGVSFAFTTQWLASVIMRKMKETVNTFPPLREWGFPKAFIWYFLLMILASFIEFEAGSTGDTVIQNLRPVLQTVMIIQGFALLFYFFHARKITVALPIMILLASLVFPIMLYIVLILGIIDLGFDLRKRLDSKR